MGCVGGMGRGVEEGDEGGGGGGGVPVAYPWLSSARETILS